MWSWFTFWLILHILAVVVGFGPTFAFPFIAARMAREPQHGGFGLHVIHIVETRLSIPLALTLAGSGTGLIFTAHVDLWRSEWLLISLALYIAAIAFSFGVQLPNVNRALRLMESMPAGPPPEGASGPPPELAALARRLDLGGRYLTLSVLVIIVLMIWRPGGAYTF